MKGADASAENLSAPEPDQFTVPVFAGRIEATPINGYAFFPAWKEHKPGGLFKTH